MVMARDRLEEYAFLGLILLLGGMSFLLIQPYLFYILTAMVLAYIAFPIYEQVQRKLRYDTVSALIVMVFLLLVAVVPTVVLADTILQQGREVLLNLGQQTAVLIDIPELEIRLAELLGRPVQIDQLIREAFTTAGTYFSDRLPALISTVLDATIGVFIMAATMYYLFTDGNKLVQTVKALLPLTDTARDRLFIEGDQMVEAILVGHLLTAVFQAVLVGIGLWLVGIPNILFWTFVMVILGVIPIVGSFLVWGPAVAYLLFFTQQIVPGLALLIYAGIVTTIGDNIIRAEVVGKRGQIHPLLVMIGVLGGLPVFGLLGVVLGPLVLGILVTTLRVYQDEYGV